MLGVFSFYSQAGQLSISACDIKPGINIEQFKSEFSVHENPKTMITEATRPEGMDDQEIMSMNRKFYHFDNYGVWVFFDMKGKFKNIRFERPFAGTVGGIMIGDSIKKIFEVKGTPDINSSRGIIYKSAGSYVNYKTMRKKVYRVFTNRCD